jgi:hypothetical protein
MTDNEVNISNQSTQGQQHTYFLECLRMLLVAGAVVHTCILQLSPDAAYNWGVYYLPKGTTDYATRFCFSALDSFLQAFVYGLLFLIEGWLTPAAFSSKGPGQYLGGQAVKLLVPLAAWELLLRPLCFYGAHSSGFGGAAGLPLLSFSSDLTVKGLYRWYFGWYRCVGENHMWFAGLLFVFKALYVAVRHAQSGCRWFCRHYLEQPPQPEAAQPFMTRNQRRQLRRAEQQQQQQQREQQQQRYFNHGQIAAALTAMCVWLTIAMFVVLNGAEYHWSLWVLNVQYCFLPQYVFAFAAGIYLSHHMRVLHRLPPKLGQCSMLAGLTVFVCGWLIDFLSVDHDLFATYTWLDSNVMFWNCWAASYTQAAAVLWSVGLLAVAGLLYSSTPSSNHPSKTITSAAYGVYVLHPLVLVAFNFVCLRSGLHPLQFAAAAVPVVLGCSWVLAAACNMLMHLVDLAQLLRLMDAAVAVSVLPGSCMQGLIRVLLASGEKSVL